MSHIGWNYYIVRNSAGDNAPDEWRELIIILGNILPSEIAQKVINKIEAVAFVIKGARIARWKIPQTHPEYSTKEECLRVAKKLIWFLMNTNSSPTISEELLRKLQCNKEENCKLFCGHKGICKNEIILKTTICPLCRKEIDIDDFKKDGRKEPLSIQIGHLVPLSRMPNSHNAENVVWFHRRCNYITGEHTLQETIEDLKKVVMQHTEFKE